MKSTTGDEDSGQVISFAGAKDARKGAPFTRHPWKYKPGACRHDAGFTIDPDDHEVTCRSCLKVIDPFKAIWIVTLAWDWEGMKSRIAQLRQDELKLAAEVARLKEVRGKERAGASLPGKYVRKTLRGLVDALKREAARCLANGDKPGSVAYARSADLLRTMAEDMVGRLIREDSDESEARR